MKVVRATNGEKTLIHYHGTPITPETAACRALSGAHAFIPFNDPRQLGLAMDVAQSFAIDNSAFTAWRQRSASPDWQLFYEWIAEVQRYPGFDFAVIPDVIDGNETANDALIEAWPWLLSAPHIGAPVWHLHESLDRLFRLATQFPRVCLGSSGEFAAVGAPQWWTRMAEAMDAICDRDGRPVCKIHGLRMLNPEVFRRFPFASADSTNVARNIGLNASWTGALAAQTKECRAMVLRERIEAHQSPTFWHREHAPIQVSLWAR